MNKPNVVVFVSHDTGRFVNPYGYSTVDTPNFSRMTEKGVTFEQSFCTTPLCSPARAALVTGQYPHQNGMMGLPGDSLGGWDLEKKDKHLAAVFKENGYSTVLCGFEHETQDFFSVGFEEGINGYGAGNNGGESILGAGSEIDTWLTENPTAGKENPFYMQIGCGETHRSWDSEDAYEEKGIWEAPYLIDDPEVDKEMAEFQGSVNKLDQGLGMIMDAFDKHGLTENTIFVITTDHGIDFPRAKGTMFDPGVEVFLFMRYDGGDWPQNKRVENLVSHVDVYPTILEACGIEVPAETAGNSFLPLLEGDEEFEIRDTLYFEKTYHDNYDPRRALRTDRYKYIYNFDAQTLYDVRIATAPRYNWFKFPIKKYDKEELYDLKEDPNEKNNLADEPGYKDLCEKFKKRLARWMKETNDPLLEGPIPSPSHLKRSAEMKSLAVRSN